MRSTSFRLVDGRVRNLNGHLQRLRLDGKQLARVRTELRAAGPGAYHPIIRAAGSSVEVVIRPDRPIEPTIIIDAHPHKDQRLLPTVKGPDLGWLSTRMDISRRRGCSEGLLTYNNKIVEGIFTSPLVFHGTTVLWSAHPRALPSTTNGQLLPLLQAHGFTLKPVRGFAVHELRDGEVWLVNAFAGIRKVTQWMEYGALESAASGSAPDIAEANAWLWEQAEEV
ncbi:aminotransferase class IV [Corynebacterium sp.]|uniref:aminotransferase class IV n=1 Tax=Corynebacterium sp. TaxID=1720 RepID=UPI0026DDA805|nr:aminotransferase class IV [Corynebacterium sp.]MDO5076267.1 aminotransferase class IV [Corynebacterium sp.]